jgi:hypothetical protein
MKAIYCVMLVSAGLGLSSLQPLNAQAVSSAEIHGVVTDPSGAIIAGAQVKATQSETGQVRTTVSNRWMRKATCTEAVRGTSEFSRRRENTWAPSSRRRRQPIAPGVMTASRSTSPPEQGCTGSSLP